MTRGNLAGALALGALTLTSACAPSTHTAQWYATHIPEMKARLDLCERLGIAQGDQDCANAAAGELIALTHGTPVNPYGAPAPAPGGASR
jgi:hypothetical protein